ncbi:hypothetical protein V054_02713, partial [Staphylococcus aureus MSSA-47]
DIFIELFISEIVHTEDSFLLKLYYKINFATEPFNIYSQKIWMLVLLHMNVDFALFSSVINQSYLQVAPALIVGIILIFTVLKIIMYILKSIKSKNNRLL